MGSPKSAWRRVAVCAMASIWLAGCANNESSAPISSVGGGSATTVERAPQLGQPRAVVSGGEQGQVNVFRKEILFTTGVMTIFRKVPIPARHIR